MRRYAIAAVVLGTAGCIAPPSTSQRLTEAAIEMNTATRFGRMDVALERVRAKAQSEFLRRHAAWGAGVRVVDLEFGGFELVQSDEAEVYIDVVWLHPDDATVRVTKVVQRWHDERGTWQLVDESRKDGDSGLLGEKPSKSKSAAEDTDASQRPKMHVGLETTRIIREE